MKNVLMTLFLLSGLGMTQLMAQTCAPPCPPCPPGCCIKACKANAGVCLPQAGAASAENAVVTCTPAEVAACKAAVASCGTTETASIPLFFEQTPSCASGGTVEIAKCVGDYHKAQAVTAADASRGKSAKTVAIKG